MSITKTLGGDRLGSGKKMKVHLHNYERSTHDIGYVFRTTMSAGTLVPFMNEVATPGTTFDINLGCNINTHPTIGPLFGSFKVQLDLFLCPFRLYMAALHNNMFGVGRNMSQVKLPLIEFLGERVDPAKVKDWDNCQVNPSSLPAYLGIRGIGLCDDSVAIGATQPRQFNAIDILAYWDTIKNYYSAKQEEIAAVIHNDVTVASASNFNIYNGGFTAIVAVPPGVLTPVAMTSSFPIYLGSAQNHSHYVVFTDQGEIRLDELATTWGVDLVTGNNISTFNFAKWGQMTWFGCRTLNAQELQAQQPRVVTFPLSNIDDMRTAILAKPMATPFVINTDYNNPPYSYLYQKTGSINSILSSQEGLALKTYQSDLFNNWLKTENIEAISDATAIDTSSGAFSIDTFIISRKVWNMLNRINVSGGSYDDWLDAVYVHDRYRSQETPMYQGGLIKELVFQEVVSNADSLDQPLGTLAGKGQLSGKHKGGTAVIHVDEPSLILGLISLTPRVDYSQGNRWHIHLKTIDDLHKPPLDEIGFQELLVEQMAWWDTFHNATTGWTQRSAGKQPAWLNYMTNVNRTFGNFAVGNDEIAGQMFMTLNRRYESEDGGLSGGERKIKDLTSYIDPSKYNFIFAQTAIDAQNFWVQIGVDIQARRKMSGKLMPNL